jgi:DNA repair protein RecO (recombination protein O)
VARARVLTRAHSVSTHALLLKRVTYSETDLVLTLFTRELGRLSALARGARRSQRRFGGALEPMHTLGVRLDEREGAELLMLREASIVVARRQLVGDLDRIDAAGRALAWLRRVAPVRTSEPELWTVVTTLLDRLDDPGRAPKRELAEAGLALLEALGWGIDFSRCVRCGKPCEPGLGAYVDPALGGLVCRACGGARRRLPEKILGRLRNARLGALLEEDADIALELVETGLRAHAGVS